MVGYPVPVELTGPPSVLAGLPCSPTSVIWATPAITGTRAQSMVAQPQKVRS
jgi:hypothetical protein